MAQQAGAFASRQRDAGSNYAVRGDPLPPRIGSGHFPIRLGYALIALLFAVRGIAAAEQIVAGTLTASLDSGSLAGTKFRVFFGYDAAHVSPRGNSFVQLESLDFKLLGVPFTLSDIYQGGQVILHDGQVENVVASFQVRLPPNSPVKNITFGFGGAGVIGYVDWANNAGTGSFELAAVAAALNAASFAPGQPIAPGALVSIFGSGLCLESAAAVSVPLPTTLRGVSVTIGGIAAPLLYVSPRQVNVQVPWSIASGGTHIVLTTNGATLPALHTAIGSFSPGIFSTHSGAGQAIAVSRDGALAAPEGSIPGVKAHAARVGDSILIFATGLGSVSPAISDGATSRDVLRNTITTPTVLIGGVSARVTFSGLAREFVGVNQINVIVPPVGPGVVPLQIELAGIRTTRKVTIAVRNP
jgi:uncharacterized protein (TIGR03437 family)